MARNQFASKFGTMAAIAGSAVGLGNIWKFPYVAGQNGGAAFLIIYIVISLLISVPVMLSEFVIGRRGQGNTYRSFINSSGKKYVYSHDKTTKKGFILSSSDGINWTEGDSKSALEFRKIAQTVHATTKPSCSADIGYVPQNSSCSPSSCATCQLDCPSKKDK